MSKEMAKLAYCFQSTEERRDLFAEAWARASVMAVHDYPRHRDALAQRAAALACCAVLSSEVCCAVVDPYQQLVMSAWMSSYRAFATMTEREIVQAVAELKGLPLDEALALLRSAFACGYGRDCMDDWWAKYQTALLAGRP